jgi:hypothetical protein
LLYTINRLLAEVGKREKEKGERAKGTFLSTFPLHIPPYLEQGF